MRLHAKAALTLKQRQQVKQLYEHRFGVHERTIHRWIKRDSPDDRSSAPDQASGHPAARDAVLANRALANFLISLISPAQEAPSSLDSFLFFE